jgi:ubiquinol-cytochrome c reductase cytochrome b subunit
MFSALLALLVLPFSDLSKVRGIQFRPISKIVFVYFVAIFCMLAELGAKHVETPFIELGQFATAAYFAFFVVLIPLITPIENGLTDLAVKAEIKDDKKEIYTSNILIQGKNLGSKIFN